MLFGFDDDVLPQESRAPESAATPAAPPETRGRRWLAPLVGLAAGLAIGLALWSSWPDDDRYLSEDDIDAAITDALAARADEPAAAAVVFNQIAPSLVVVRALHGDTSGANPSEAPSSTIGTGVVINESGQILTANHVVQSASAIELIFADGSSSPATVVTTETERDIAVLEASGSTGTLTPAVLGNSRTLTIGDPVYAVGNPLGLTASITAGVVSGLDRSLPFPDDADLVLSDLIQFDAAVNQGNSGGPLVNSQGQVVGIITALADPTGQGFFVGIGFAIPIDIAAGGAANGPSQ